MKNIFNSIILALIFPAASMACSVCFGGADSNMVKGFTWGIIILGALPYLLLVGFVTTIFLSIRKNSLKNKAHL